MEGKGWKRCGKALTSSGQWTESISIEGFLAYSPDIDNVEVTRQWTLDFWLVAYLVFEVVYCFNSTKSLLWSLSDLIALLSHTHTFFLCIYVGFILVTLCFFVCECVWFPGKISEFLNGIWYTVEFNKG